MFWEPFFPQNKDKIKFLTLFGRDGRRDGREQGGPAGVFPDEGRVLLFERDPH